MCRWNVRAFLVPALTALAISLAGASVVGGENEFVGGTGDVPLAPGLIEDSNANVVFDSPTGRIVESYAYGEGAVADVNAFYADTLPQLGWLAVGPGVFRREGEILRIRATREEGAANRIVVRFSLSPDSSAAAH